MDKTLFELVPVSVKPDVAGEYSVCYSEDGIADTSSLWEPERGWYNDRYTDTPITHYLRPLPPPVAEERTQDELWRELVDIIGSENTLDDSRLVLATRTMTLLSKTFHLTLK